MRQSLRISCAVVLFLFAGLQGPAAKGQRHEPLTEGEIIRLLLGGVAPERVATMARESGIAFEVSPAVEGDLRDAGANDRLLQTLRELSAGAGEEKGKKQPAKTGNPGATTTILLITVDAPCKLNVDGEDAGALAAGAPKRVSVPLGDHLIHAVSTEETSAAVDWTGRIDTTEQQLLQLKLADKVEKATAVREAQEAEHAERARLNNFSDIIGRWKRTYEGSYFITWGRTVYYTDEEYIEVRAEAQHETTIEGAFSRYRVKCSREDKGCRLGQSYSSRVVLSHDSPGKYSGTEIEADGARQRPIHIKLISPTNLDYCYPGAISGSPFFGAPSAFLASQSSGPPLLPDRPKNCETDSGTVFTKVSP